jgi:30S ribosomal protein S31
LVPGLFNLLTFATKLLNSSIMGRGDKKTAKGKRFKGSFGKSRPANKKADATAAKKKAAKKKG